MEPGLWRACLHDEFAPVRGALNDRRVGGKGQICAHAALPLAALGRCAASRRARSSLAPASCCAIRAATAGAGAAGSDIATSTALASMASQEGSRRGAVASSRLITLDVMVPPCWPVLR
jgi:hypothetical protein